MGIKRCKIALLFGVYLKLYWLKDTHRDTSDMTVFVWKWCQKTLLRIFEKSFCFLENLFQS